MIHFEYIDDNLEKVLQSPNSIICLRPYDVGSKRALFALFKEDEGVYKKVQLTKEQSKLEFPFAPIKFFKDGPGYSILKRFIIFDGIVAINTTNMDGFRSKMLDSDKKYISIFATFTDGSAAFVMCEKIKKFQKAGELKPYITMLKERKDCKQIHDSYFVIEHHQKNNDTFIISELQQQKI